MPITSNYLTASKQNPSNAKISRQPSNLTHHPVQFAGGNPLDTIDPNNLEQIKNLPAHLALQQIAATIAPKTSNPAVMEYLAQRFQQKFSNVDHPVNPNRQQTLLHIAVSAGRPKLVEVLLNEGANPLTENKKEQSAIDWALTQISKDTPTNDRLVIANMLLNWVSTHNKQQKETSATAAGSSSWFSGWGLGSLFAPQKEAPKPAAEALANERQQSEPKAASAAPSVEPAAEELVQKELAQLEQAKTLLQSHLAEARSNIKQLEHTAKKAVQDKKQMQQEKKQLEAECEQLRSEATRLENEANQRQTADSREIKRLSKKEENLKKRLEQKTEDLQKAEQKLQAMLLTQDTQLKDLQASHAQQIANLTQELQQAQKMALRPSPEESPASSSSSLAPAQSPQDRVKSGKLYAKINGLQTELSKANARIHQLSEELMLAQKQYREWIARLLQEKDSLNFQLARTQWQRDESAFILPKVHQVNEQLVANINNQGRELQTLRQSLNQQQAALSALLAHQAQQALQIQEQTDLIQRQEAQKNTLSKTVKHLMALSTSHRSVLQRQELGTYQSMLNLLAEKIQSASSDQPASGLLAELEADLKTLIGYRRKQMESYTVLSTALASLPPEEPEDSSDGDTPSAARRFPLRSRSFR